MKRNGTALGARVLSVLSEAGRKGISSGEVVTRVAELEPERRPRAKLREGVARELESLERSGLAVLWARRWYDVAATDWRVGVVGGREGDFTEVRARGREGQVYSVRDNDLNGARRGDRVLLKRLHVRQRTPRPEASITRILERRHKVLVGRASSQAGKATLVPFEPMREGSIELYGDVPSQEDVWVLADPDEDTRGGVLRGRVSEVLGSSSEPGVDVRVILEHFAIPDTFPREVLEAARRLPRDPAPEDYPEREDLRNRVLVTIDGESARDFDDAISVERLRSGYRLGVHIADVAEYVTEGSVLDQEALRRGTSVYLPDRAVPMLPERLSNGLCSLRPDVPRLALSVFLDYDASGNIRSTRFAETLIQSAARLTYEQVQAFFDGKIALDEDVADLLDHASALLEVLLDQRLERGALDFDLPVGRVVVDSEGRPLDVEQGQRLDAHRLIEQMMVAANEAVARELDAAEVPALYRAHAPPSALRVSELAGVLRSLGLEMPEGGYALISESPSPLQALLRNVEGQPEEQLVATLVLRTMERARYDDTNRGHYALGLEDYCHFTSPIRRYPDLIVHRQLKQLLRGEPFALREGASSSLRLSWLAERTSEAEQRAEQAERSLQQWKKVRMLTPKVGEVFEGRVTGVQPFGLFVQLDEWLVDGLVHISSLRDDFYVFDEMGHLLEGEATRRTFRLADSLQVRLVGVSETHRGLDLEVEDMPREPSFRRRGLKRRERSGERRGRGDRPRQRRKRRKRNGGRRS